MPANLSPDYKRAEADFKEAREPGDRLLCLKEMLRTIPKHKGTEHLQAELKTRVKQLTEELAAGKKGGARKGPQHVVRPEGAAQIALIGPPNSGKSALHARLSGSHAEVGPYAFTTQSPLPGMLPYEDVHFQLVDLPPVSREHPVPWIGNALQPADGAMLVVDLGDPACVEHVGSIRDILAKKRITLLEAWGAPGEDDESDAGDDIGDPFAVRLPTLLVAAKADTLGDVEAEVQVLEDLADVRFPVIATSVESGEGLDRVGPWWFETLGVVRVYTKAPGRPADTDRPFTVRAGDPVVRVAALVHQDIAESLKYAKLWRAGGRFNGQQVGRDHPVCDGDIVELHG